MFRWEARKEKVLRGIRIIPEKKLEGLRQMNELADQVLTIPQKLMRQKLRNK